MELSCVCPDLLGSHTDAQCSGLYADPALLKVPSPLLLGCVLVALLGCPAPPLQPSCSSYPPGRDLEDFCRQGYKLGALQPCNRDASGNMAEPSPGAACSCLAPHWTPSPGSLDLCI